MRYAVLAAMVAMVGCEGGGLESNDTITVPAGQVSNFPFEDQVASFKTDKFPLAVGVTYRAALQSCHEVGAGLMTDDQYTVAKGLLYQNDQLEWVKPGNGVSIEARSPIMGDSEHLFVPGTTPGIAYRCAYNE